MMTTQRLDGGNQRIELLLVIMIVAMLATIVATSFDLFEMPVDRTSCVATTEVRIGSSSSLDDPIQSRQELAAWRGPPAQPGSICAG